MIPPKRSIQSAMDLLRINNRNRKLVAAWISLLSAIAAAFALGVSWNDSDPLIFGEEDCTQIESSLLWICTRGEDRFIVYPMHK